jgi:glycosyltransferase involved in cell wall biosynthesis
MSAGGAERQASLLCNHWARSGREVVLATLRDEPSHYDLHDTVVRRAIRRDRSSSSLRKQWSDLESIRGLIASERPHVVAAFMDAINIKVLLAARKSGVPVIISERSIPGSLFTAYGPWYGAIVALLRRFIYPLSTALVVQTEPVASWARRGRLSRKVAVIPNVIEPKREGDDAERRSSKLILSVGRLSHEKGHDVLIHAFAGVADRFPDWRLKIIGDGVLRAELSALIDRLGLEDRVELAPTQKSVAEDYRTAGIFVLSSRFEGFPNALMEAMQAGCPVVSADCPVGPGEILTDGSDGIFFRNEDFADLEAKLSMLMADEARRVALAVRARQTVRKYGPSAVFPLWDNLVDSVRLQTGTTGSR